MLSREMLAGGLVIQVYLLARLRLSDQLRPPGVDFLIMYEDAEAE